MRRMRSRAARCVVAAALVMLQPACVSVAQTGQAEISLAPTYADLAEMADSAQLVLRVQIRSMTRVEDERSPGLRPGEGRYYVKARTLALLYGNQGVGDALTYLVDLPLDARGKPPPLKKQEVLLFARPVKDHPEELQLVTPDAQVLWSEATEATLRSILASIAAPGAPPAITGVRDAIYVPGTLAGAGETQIFLTTANGSAASITVAHRPGQPPAWGVSFSELTADTSKPPQHDTLEWYRLACFLPNGFPDSANLSETWASRQQAVADYRMVLGELGVCSHNRH